MKVVSEKHVILAIQKRLRLSRPKKDIHPRWEFFIDCASLFVKDAGLAEVIKIFEISPNGLIIDPKNRIGRFSELIQFSGEESLLGIREKLSIARDHLQAQYLNFATVSPSALALSDYQGGDR